MSVDPAEGPLHDELEVTDPADLKRLAMRGASALTLRGVVIRVAGFAGNIALVRLLEPRAFGLVAVGAAVAGAAAFSVDGGLAAGLVRRQEPPSPTELGTIRTLQIVALLLMSGVSLAGYPLGHEVAEVTAAMIVAATLATFQTPYVVACERSLDMRPVAVAEVIQAAAYAAVAVTAAELGLGVWSLVLGAVARTAAGTAYFASRRRVRLPVRPQLREVRGLLAIGVRFQAVGLALVIRDELANLVIGAAGSVRVLGYYEFVGNAVQAPNVALEGLYRITYPLLSRMRAAGYSPTSSAATITSVAVLVGSAAVGGTDGFMPHGLRIVFGAKWLPALPALAWYSLAVVLVAPLGVAASGLLQAAGHPLRLAAAIGTNALVLLLVAAVLVPHFGATGAGAAFAASGLAETVMLGVALRDVVTVRHLWPQGRMSIAAVAATAVAYQVGWTTSDDVAGAVLGGLAGVSLGVGAVTAASPRQARQAAQTMLRALGAVRRPATSEA